MPNSLPASFNVDLRPRLKSSTQWTALPAEFAEKIKGVFTRQFAIEANHGQFLVDGRIYPGEVIVRMGYLEKGRLRQINFEASMDLPPRMEQVEEDKFGEENLTMDRIYACIDALGSLMEEYFKAGSVDHMDVALNWQQIDFEGEEVFVQYSTVNSTLEQEADRILREAGLGGSATGLVNAVPVSEDAMENAEIDSDLAMEVQKLIREGKHPLQQGPSSDEQLN